MRSRILNLIATAVVTLTAVMLLSACGIPACTSLDYEGDHARAAYLVTCETPEAYGAVPNDGIDDRVAIQAAFTAGQSGAGCVVFGEGQYHARVNPTSGANNVASLKVTAPLEVYGAGQGVSTITMLGSGIKAGNTNPGDWHLIAASAALHLHDLSITGADRTNTGEQTHLVQLNAGSVGSTLERLYMDLQTIGPSSGGDCVRMLGTAASHVSSTTIRDIHMDHCDRAGVGFQRYVDYTTIQRVTTTHTETTIDLEPTGNAGPNCNPIINGVFVSDSDLGRGDYATGEYNSSFMGRGCELASNIRIQSTVIRDGGLNMLDVGDVTLIGLNLKNRPGFSGATLQARKRVVRLRVIGGSIERVVGSTAGQVVKVTGQSGFTPTDATLLGVDIVQQVDGGPVYAESLSSLVLADCNIYYNGPSTTTFAVKNRGIDAPAGAPVLVDTTITGPLGGIAEMAGTTDGGTPVVVRTTLN